MLLHTPQTIGTLATGAGRAPVARSILCKLQPHCSQVCVTSAAAAAAALHGSGSSSSSRASRVLAAATAPAAADRQQSPADAELRASAVALSKVADDTKALDISVLHVEPICSWTSYMVLCTVMSKPQLLAVLTRIEDAAAEHGLTKQNSAGSSQWEVLDFGSVVVHVFTADQREYYNLDDFYALAEEVELPFVSATSGLSSTFEQAFAGDLNSGGGSSSSGSSSSGSSSSGSSGLWSKSI